MAAADDVLANIFADSDDDAIDFEGWTLEEIRYGDFPTEPCQSDDENDLTEREKSLRRDVHVNIEDDPAGFTELPFEGNPGLTSPENIPFGPDVRPLDFFKLFFSDADYENIAEETNRYAASRISVLEDRGLLATYSRFRKWENGNKADIKVFLALCTAMGLVEKRDLETYWSTDQVLQTPGFREIMSRDRFEMILEMLHLNNNNNYIPPGRPHHDPLFKLCPILDSVLPRFRSVYTPHQHITIDEAMIAGKGNYVFVCTSQSNLTSLA
ncbi:piggyBac transposable element-derived protein 4-like [Ptychodera flava]|uniref:piggyBac transposable element-derived protein 4-like n=1 Tax=Ptychodera flava TaxID=63121 RepID=UPI003969F9BD